MSREIKPSWIVAWTGAVVLAFAAACASESTDNTDNAGNCGNKATDSCVPTVGPSESLTVDAISYSLKRASTSSTIGDPSVFGEEANGVFVILKLRAKSRRKETGTFTTDVFKLYAGGKTYDADDAAITSYDKNFFLEDIGPDTTGTGIVAFDVAPKVLKRKPKLRIGELGLGSTYGYIRLPNLSS